MVVLLDEVKQEMDNSGIVRNELTVEVDKAKE